MLLTLAYVSSEALEASRETGYAHYHSRSRGELWKKGGSSGHLQHVDGIRVDCDGDASMYIVDRIGGACHTGYRSCFYRTIEGETTGEKVSTPKRSTHRVIPSFPRQALKTGKSMPRPGGPDRDGRSGALSRMPHWAVVLRNGVDCCSVTTRYFGQLTLSMFFRGEGRISNPLRFK